ncbi:hypothetical protein ACFLQQ_03215, partial [Actinomycetota bacterium]
RFYIKILIFKKGGKMKRFLKLFLILSIIVGLILIPGNLFAAPAERNSVNGGGIILEGDYMYST